MQASTRGSLVKVIKPSQFWGNDHALHLFATNARKSCSTLCDPTSPEVITRHVYGFAGGQGPMACAAPSTEWMRIDRALPTWPMGVL